MRHILLTISILIFGLSWAVAQSANDPASGSASSGQTMGQSAGGEMTVQGCLSGSNGNFTLTAKNGSTYQLTGDSSKLSEHVGHEVKITGTSGSAGSETSSGTGSQTLQVTSVKHISKSCKSGSGAMK